MIEINCRHAVWSDPVATIPAVEGVTRKLRKHESVGGKVWNCTRVPDLTQSGFNSHRHNYEPVEAEFGLQHTQTKQVRKLHMATMTSKQLNRGLNHGNVECHITDANPKDQQSLCNVPLSLLFLDKNANPKCINFGRVPATATMQIRSCGV